MKKTLRIMLILLILMIINIILANNNVFAVTIRDSYGTHLIIPYAEVELGPSMLTMNKNVFCVQRSAGTWPPYPDTKGTIIFRPTGPYTVSDEAKAYILSQEKNTTTRL